MMSNNSSEAPGAVQCCQDVLNMPVLTRSLRAALCGLRPRGLQHLVLRLQVPGGEHRQLHRHEQGARLPAFTGVRKDFCDSCVTEFLKCVVHTCMHVRRVIAMTPAQVGGFLQRIDYVRKYAFGVMCILNDGKGQFPIRCAWSVLTLLKLI